MQAYQSLESISMNDLRQSSDLPSGQTSKQIQDSSKQAETPYRDHLFRHRDFLRRPFQGNDRNEKFLSPYNGRLRDLVVQSSDGVLASKSGALWYRTDLKNGSPWIIRLSTWALSSNYDSEGSVTTDYHSAAIRWIPACIAITVVVGSILGFVIDKRADPRLSV